MRRTIEFSRGALLVSLCSLLLWTGWNYVRGICHPNTDLSCGIFTDASSHISLTRAFVEFGADIYEKPRGELGRLANPDEFAALPSDLQQFGSVRIIDGWPPDKPFSAHWMEVPSYYPPGNLVVFAPPAAIYSFTDISFSESNRLAIQFLLVYAHITLFLLLTLIWREFRSTPAMLIVVVIIYGPLIRWTLEGFYDGAWIAPLLITPFFLRDKKPLAALTTFAMGFFMHFRALFYLPWAISALSGTIMERDYRPLKWRKGVACAAIVLLGGAAVLTFARLRERMSAHNRSNPFHPGYGPFDKGAFWALLAIVLVATIVLLVLREWREVIALVWIVGLIISLPEVADWNAISLIPWLIAPPLRIPREDEERPEIRPRPFSYFVRAASGLAIIGLVFPGSLSFDWYTTAVERILT